MVSDFLRRNWTTESVTDRVKYTFLILKTVKTDCSLHWPSHHNVWKFLKYDSVLCAFPASVQDWNRKTLGVLCYYVPTAANGKLWNVVPTVALYWCDYGSVGGTNHGKRSATCSHACQSTSGETPRWWVLSPHHHHLHWYWILELIQPLPDHIHPSPFITSLLEDNTFSGEIPPLHSLF